jgi:hypothetical protein
LEPNRLGINSRFERLRALLFCPKQSLAEFIIQHSFCLLD